MKLEWLEPTHPAEAISPGELADVGVTHEVLPAHDGAFQPALDRLKAERGYLEQDIIELAPDTENLEQICAKFTLEHLHTDDEVRYVLEGEGIFDIRSAGDRWMRVTLQQGDLLVVPAHLHHRFLLTPRKHIRCVRLFKDSAGWVPHYRTKGEAQGKAEAKPRKAEEN
jgi:1,2-dihydroxy-3-keto-5-methylthiopentene dioxygenase